ASVQTEVDQLLAGAGVAARRRKRASTILLRERLRDARVSGIWLVGVPPTGNPWRVAKRARLHRKLWTLAGAHALQYGLWLLSWWMVGLGILEGRVDTGWFAAWALLLFTLIPFRLISTWLAGTLAIGAGGLLKQRLLVGVLKLEPDEIRHQ